MDGLVIITRNRLNALYSFTLWALGMAFSYGLVSYPRWSFVMHLLALVSYIFYTWYTYLDDRKSAYYLVPICVFLVFAMVSRFI